MVRLKDIFGKLSQWAGPSVFLLVTLILLSYIVTYMRKDRRKTMEYLTMMENSPPARNASVEKARDLLPYLKTLLLSSHPQRIDLTNDEEREKSQRDDRTWQDLTENENDFYWSTKPLLTKKGFRTAGHTLRGPSAKKFELEATKEFTVIIHSSALSTQDDKVNQDEHVEQDDRVTPADVISNAELSNAGKKDQMTINIPANVSDKFTELKKLLKDEQTQEIIQKSLELSSAIAQALLAGPSPKKQRSPVAVRFQGNQDVALEIRVPDRYGVLDVSVAGHPVPTKFKILPSDSNYYAIVYRNTDKGGHLKAYVNTAEVIDQPVHKMYFDESPVVINPNGGWDANLKSIAFLNRALHPAELALFRAKNVVLRALTEAYDKHNLVPGIKPPKGCQCIGVCKGKNVKAFNPYAKHPKVPDDENLECKATCVCDDKKPYDPYDPNRVPQQDEYQDLLPLGPGGNWIDPSVCPPVTKDCDGNYNWNGVSYGKNRRRAREIYRINNPSCRRIPSELDDWYNKDRPLDKNCPFKVDSPFNPCRHWACENVDWESGSPKDMNRGCKRRISAYCEEHPYLDDMCRCWQKEHRNSEKCRKFRAKFDDPRDHGIDAGSFEISEHPDYDKYIRKDRIPCWGCDLEQSSGKDECPPGLYKDKDGACS